MITRKQYMNKEATHEEYYGQFVGDREKNVVCRYIGKSKIVGSEDPHFNDISLRQWDSLPLLTASTHKAFKEAGDWVSLSSAVCVYKEAARQIKQENT